ncbi:MAG: AbiEi antitoxin N-terminal domain-containing protein, partial [Oleiphilaceae bacterium]|nr:AbiEi antitoxin N-terminal domain-containing protein [Oleiphilaceae bacterium]
MKSSIDAMEAERTQNLKKVLATVPAGYLVDAPWLTSQGIAYETFRDYVKRGWLERVSRGVFRRPTTTTKHSHSIDWKIGLLSVQQIMGYNVHVGGTTALAQHGYEHYLHLGSDATVWVYGNDIPNWLPRLTLNAPIQTRSTSLFTDSILGLVENPPNTETTLPWDWKLRMSTPERAI